jgi:hypothetical protein
MLITLVFDTEFFADKMFRSLIERFFQSEITHTEVAARLNQQPELDISENSKSLLDTAFFLSWRDL